MKPEHKRLVTLAQQGDESALLALEVDTYKVAYKAANLVLESKGLMYASDEVCSHIDTKMRGIIMRADPDADNEFTTFLSRSATGYALNYCNRILPKFTQYNEEVQYIADEKPDTFTENGMGYYKDQVLRNWDNLGERDQEFLTLVFEGMDNEELMKHYNVSNQGLANKITHVIRRVKEKM